MTDKKSEPGSRQKELDDFWDIDSLLPPRMPSRVPPRPAAAAPTAVEIELDTHPARQNAPADSTAQDTVGSVPLTVRREQYPQAEDSRPNPYGATHAPRGDRPLTVDNGKPHFVPPHTAEDEQREPPALTYTPDGVLLHKVSVYEWKSNYHYFDEFAQDAAVFASRKPPQRDVRREPFFSFFPQYGQMKPAQTAWYLAWREKVRRGQYPDTDYAYILLYLFELINLPTDTQPDAAAEAASAMADVWIAYRKKYPQLDHYMCEWLCDYCLVHQLNAPVDRLAPALGEIIEMSSLKEFYLTAAVTGDDHDVESARILLRHCCQYDYHKSKFAQGEYAALFDRVIPGAVAHILPLLLGRAGTAPLVTMQDSHVTRDAFTGALCAYRNKRRIEVAYTSFSRSHEFRFLIGDAVKHIENRLRGWIGVRSRLSVMTLPNNVRDALDDYLRPLAPAVPAAQPQKNAPRPEYEKLYDLPRKPVTLADADAIEQSSWDTTRILTDAFSDADESCTDTPDTLSPTEGQKTDVEQVPDEGSTPLTSTTAPLAPTDLPACDVTPTDPLAAALGDLCGFVRLALAEDGAGQRAYAVSRRTMPDALAEAVNTVTSDSDLGDIILDDRGDGVYTVLEEYRDIVRQALDA